MTVTSTSTISSAPATTTTTTTTTDNDQVYIIIHRSYVKDDDFQAGYENVEGVFITLDEGKDKLYSIQMNILLDAYEKDDDLSIFMDGAKNNPADDYILEVFQAGNVKSIREGAPARAFLYHPLAISEHNFKTPADQERKELKWLPAMVNAKSYFKSKKQPFPSNGLASSLPEETVTTTEDGTTKEYEEETLKVEIN